MPLLPLVTQYAESPAEMTNSADGRGDSTSRRLNLCQLASRHATVASSIMTAVPRTYVWRMTEEYIRPQTAAARKLPERRASLG